MLLNKNSLSLFVALACSSVSCSENNTQDIDTNTQETRTVHITKCKKIEFGLTIDQSQANEIEREEALQIISNFCNTHVNTLSEELAAKTPNISISLILINIQEDENMLADANSLYTNEGEDITDYADEDSDTEIQFDSED